MPETMTNKLPFLEVRPGAAVCLHVGTGMSIFNEVFVGAIEKHFHDRGYTVAKATPPFFQSRPRSLFSRLVKESAAGWLAGKARISKQQAEAAIKRINSHGLTSDCQFSTLAGTPKTLLAIAAAVMVKPRVLLYPTEALDAMGVIEVHNFVRTCRQDLGLFAVHISTPSVHGDGSPAKKICPPECSCLDL